MQSPESQWELEALLQYECSITLLLQITQLHGKYCLDPREQEDSSPGLQLYCSLAKREFWIPFLAPGIASCKIRGRSFKPEQELRPLHIQENSLLCSSYASFCMISLLLLTGLINSLYAAAQWHGVSKRRTGNRQYQEGCCLLACYLFLAHGILNHFLQTTIAQLSGYRNLKCQQQLSASRTWQRDKDF